MALTDFITNKLFLPSREYSGSGVRNVIAPSSVLPFSVEKLKENPTANRCFNMIVDGVARVPFKVRSTKVASGKSKMRPDAIMQTLNFKPNAFMDPDFFWRSIINDLLTEGNAFIYVEDGSFYYLPAKKMTITSHPKRMVDYYEMDGEKRFQPDTIIHIKDNSSKSLLKGESRFLALKDIFELHKKMKDFQKNFFNNNAMPGVILESPNTLTEKLKRRKIEEWKQDFNPTSGARSPAFLDGGITARNLDTATFREMDFENSVQSIEKDLAKAMGVPPVLLDGGNNANISPNLRMFYLETIIPLHKKICSALSLFFGYEIVSDEVAVTALQPDLRDLANYVSTLKNAGIITANEAREEIGQDRSDDPEADNLINPANIAGSASDPSTGGRPKEPDEGEE